MRIGLWRPRVRPRPAFGEWGVARPGILPLRETAERTCRPWRIPLGQFREYHQGNLSGSWRYIPAWQGVAACSSHSIAVSELPLSTASTGIQHNITVTESRRQLCCTLSWHRTTAAYCNRQLKHGSGVNLASRSPPILTTHPSYAHVTPLVPSLLPTYIIEMYVVKHAITLYNSFEFYKSNIIKTNLIRRTVFSVNCSIFRTILTQHKAPSIF